MSPYVRELRAALGSARILLPSVAGIVRDEGGRLLLVQQRDDDIWSTPGGSIEPNETPADAVVREVWEETNLLVRPTRLLGVYGGPAFVVRYPNGDETQYVSIIFECAVESGEARPDNDETTAARYFTFEEAASARLSPWLTGVLRMLFDPTTAAWFEAPTWRP
jgi:8-oxo-dGTP pyrophosphatase MutT (NUDIX family)